MPGLNQRDLDVLGHYARTGNRELYWNYLARHEGNDGYGLLALGVVRNDSMPGAVANHFAQNRAGRTLSERQWEGFGEDLVRRDFELRQQYVDRQRPDLALNLPVRDVQLAHDGAFNRVGIDPNAWTPRQLLEAARRQGGDQAAQQVWGNMLDGRGLGLGRMGITSWDVLHRYNDAQLPALRYMGALGAATTMAAVDRAYTDPDVIGARDFYAQYDRRTGQWSSVANGEMGPHIRPITDPARLRELNDARAVRLESQAQRDDFHPADPNRNRPVARSPFTLADASGPDTDQTRLGSDTGRARLSTENAMTAPSQDALFPQALAAMTRREAEFGRVPDDNTRRIAEYATVLGVRNNYGQITDIAFNRETPKLAAGDRFFVLDGDGDNPARQRESMLTRDALGASAKQVGDDMQAALSQRSLLRDADAQKLTEKRELDVPTRSA